MAESRVSVPGYDGLVEIGRGGFGVVYRAEQSDVRRVVAIKVLTGFDDDARVRFDRERDAMGLLSSHPNIVTVFASGFSGEYPYLVLEYLDRGSLADEIADAPIGWTEAVDIGVKLAGALHAAREAGILHRDVKPENILVSSYGEPKLADFGIARLEDGPETKSGVFTASLQHAAPEVLDGKRPTKASDVYSLASTTFALIAGHAPFHRDTDESIVPLFARAATEPVPDLRADGVPDAVCRAIEHGMAKQPGERPASAPAFGEELQAAQRDLGLEATPMVIPSAGRRRSGDGAPSGQPDGSTRVVDAAPSLPTVQTSPDLPEPPEPERRRRRALLGALGGMVIVVAIIGGVVAFSGGGSEDKAPTGTGTTPSTPTSTCRSVRWSVHNGAVAPADSPPDAEVTPCEGLRDGQVVRVRAAGFDGQPAVYVHECFFAGGQLRFDQALGAAGGTCRKVVVPDVPGGARPPGAADVDVAGTAELSLPVKVGPWGEGTAPCTELSEDNGGQCALVVTTSPDRISGVTADPVFLTFAKGTK